MWQLKNGDNGVVCEGGDEDYRCTRLAYQLSSSDCPIGVALTPIQPYKRTIRYKCASGHRFDKTTTIEINRLEAQE